MPNLKLSEYICKSLYNSYLNEIKNDEYMRMQIYNEDNWMNSSTNINYVVKIDNGTKRRGKKLLIKYNLTYDEINDTIINFKKMGYNKFIIEPYYNFSEEMYLSISKTLFGIELLYSKNGGINVKNDNIEKNIIPYNIDNNSIMNHITINIDDALKKFIILMINFSNRYQLTYIEINPLVMTNNNNLIPLDFAVFFDDTSLYLLKSEELKIINTININSNDKTQEEINIYNLDKSSGASLKFKLINKNGNIWTLISGGGASVIFTDSIVLLGYKEQLSNYGEISGDPDENAVKTYCDNFFKLMIKSDNINKILFIGGGISNFTQVDVTFRGITHIIEKYKDELKNIKIYVRRGGLNYQKGLSIIKNKCDELKIFCDVNGPEIPMTFIVNKVLPSLTQNKINPETGTYTNFDVNDDLLDNIYNNWLKNKNNISNINDDDTCVILGIHINIAQRMLDYEYQCKKMNTKFIGFIDPIAQSDEFIQLFYGNKEILVPKMRNLDGFMKKYNPNIIINLLSFRSCYDFTKKILLYPSVKTIYIIAEGMAVSESIDLYHLSRLHNKNIIGPSTVGGLYANKIKIANVGGSMENILNSNLCYIGNVGLITKSGGLLNEMMNMIHKYTTGIYEAICIGGDQYPNTHIVDVALSFEKNDMIKMIIILGEVGGYEELILAKAYLNKLITKPIICWCYGTSNEAYNNEIQFGHAGAFISNKMTSANYKNEYMKHCNILVPNKFDDLEDLIKQKSIELKINDVPKKMDVMNINRKQTQFISSICDERTELKYNNKSINQFDSIGNVISNLWFKKDLSKSANELIEKIIILCADHGPCVSGAHNTIIATRAGKDIVSSIASGLLTIGDRFGGAINQAANDFYYNWKNKIKPEDFVLSFKKNGKIIMGIGHKKKSIYNPDERVKELIIFYKNNFKNANLINYALEVEKITTNKKPNLILNVDGTIACLLIDMMYECNFELEEIEWYIENDIFNGFFMLSRMIGLIGHHIDQKRYKQKLFRVNEDDVNYLL